MRAPLWISHHIKHVIGGCDYVLHCHNYLWSVFTTVLLRPQNTKSAQNFLKKWQPFGGPNFKFYPNVFSDDYNPCQHGLHGTNDNSGSRWDFEIGYILLRV